MTCRWDNTTAHDVGFSGRDVRRLHLLHARRRLPHLRHRRRRPRLIDGGDGGCGAPGDLGDAHGVGRYCTAEGGECKGNDPAATFCIAAFSDHNYCTIIFCQDHAACGPAAHCEPCDGACVPDYCE